jgi:membrane associated rhomboid family serine protease
LLFVLAIWTVYWFEIRFSNDLTTFGVYPRTLEGLRGVFFSPFLHGSLDHLYSNTIPAFLLIAALRYFYRDNFWQVVLYGILFSGILTWIIARESYHIGASGLIYVLVSFIFFKGIRSQYYRLVSLSLVIIMVYGGMIWYVFPDIEEGISWEGHLAGLITGLVMAVIFKTPDYKKFIKYDWEQPDYNPVGDKFMERFDENGNFVNVPKPEVTDSIIETNPFQNTTSNNGFQIVYHFKNDEKLE